MALIVMADDGVAFDGATAESAPLGGAERAFVALAEAFAARGHGVEVRNRCAAPLTHNGVRWAPLGAATPEVCDLYIGNRGHRVIGLAPRARRRLFWLHNPAGYLRKPRNLWRLAWHRPTLVVTGAYHRATVPRWLPRAGCVTIPYGVPDRFRGAVPRQPPPPRAIFTSNPLRGLEWLLDLWRARIRPAVPGAELHIYAGAALGSAKASRITDILTRAAALSDCGVAVHPPAGHRGIVDALTGARAMLYRGDPGETFCLALAEAQALGVPAVVTPLGAVPERIVDGLTGAVAADEDAFVAAATAYLRDDALWQRAHRAALDRQRGLSWDEIARRFEALMR